MRTLSEVRLALAARYGMRENPAKPVSIDKLPDTITEPVLKTVFEDLCNGQETPLVKAFLTVFDELLADALGVEVAALFSNPELSPTIYQELQASFTERIFSDQFANDEEKAQVLLARRLLVSILNTKKL
jgi:hypothetical protein